LKLAGPCGEDESLAENIFPECRFNGHGVVVMWKAWFDWPALAYQVPTAGLSTYESATKESPS